MIAQVALIRIDFADASNRERGIDRQRRFARKALLKCAEMCGAPRDGWKQNEARVPIPNGPFHWSISHKRTCAAAVIADSPVGIDIERIAPRKTDLFDEIASANEWDMFGERNWSAFFRIWTAKEATLKANGVGIGRLSDCRVVRYSAPGDALTTFNGKEWQIEFFEWMDHVSAVTREVDGVRWHIQNSASLEVDPSP